MCIILLPPVLSELFFPNQTLTSTYALFENLMMHIKTKIIISCLGGQGWRDSKYFCNILYIVTCSNDMSQLSFSQMFASSCGFIILSQQNENRKREMCDSTYMSSRQMWFLALKCWTQWAKMRKKNPISNEHVWVWLHTITPIKD